MDRRRASGGTAGRREAGSRPPKAAPGPGSVQARALALQRATGNRAAARVLSRWQKHPDAEQKGVMVPDAVAEDFDRFNPPKNA